MLVRIAQVVSAFHPHIGGVETHVQRLAHGCVEAGDQVTVFTHQINDSPAEEWMGGVRVLRFPLTVRADNYPASIRLFQHLKAHAVEFDLVHAHSYHTLMGHAAMRTKLPFVYTPHYHGTGHSPLRAVMHRLYRSLGTRQFSASDAVIANSDAEKYRLLKDFPWIASKVTTILPGTDPISPAAADDNQLDLVGLVVLVVGRLERYKNVDLVVRAFRSISIDANLVIVGEGPDRARLESYANDHAHDRSIRFTGRISDELLHQLLARADLVVAASDHEAFGLSVAEGLAAGAAVLASGIPAHKEIAERAGADAPITLIDMRDSRKFKEQMETLLQAERPGDHNFQLPSWADFVRKVRDLYLTVSPSRLTTADGSVTEGIA
jgi:glycosyltransferase involved in cell wall biosynthesis